MAIGDGRLAKRMINVRFDDTANMEPWSHGGGTTLYIYMHVEELQLHLHCLFAWNICMQQSQPVGIGGTCGKHVFISLEHSYLGSFSVEMTADTGATYHHARGDFRIQDSQGSPSHNRLP